MTVFRYFMKLTWRKKTSLFIYLVIFIVLNMSIANQINKETPTLKDMKPDGYILNKDNSEVSKKLVEFIGSKSKLRTDITEDNKDQKVFEGAIDYYLEIPEGFGDAFNKGNGKVNLQTDPKSFNSFFVENELSKYMMFLESTKDAEGKYDFKKVESALNVRANVEMKYEKDDVKYFSAAMLSIMAYSTLAVFIFTLGSVMKEFNDDALELRNRSTPISTGRFSLEIFLGQIVTGLIIYSVFLVSLFILVPGIINTLPISKILINGFSYTLAGLGFSFLLCTFSTEKNFLYGASNAIPLGLAFISGSMVPLEFLGESVKNIARFFPLYYYNVNNMNLTDGIPITQGVITMLIFGVLYFIVGIIITKIKKGEPLINLSK